MTVPPSNPISYLNPLQANIPWVSYGFAPTTTDIAFSIPTVWVDSGNSTYYVLVSKAGGVAVWKPITQAAAEAIGSINSVLPDGTGNFTISSSDGSITVSPVANGLNLQASGSNQDRFYCSLLNDLTNVTGDGTLYTIIYNQPLLNPSNVYNTTTGVFTAPVTGLYAFNVCFQINDISSSHIGLILELSTSPPDVPFSLLELNPFSISINNQIKQNISFILYLPASFSFSIQLGVSYGTKTIGLNAASNSFSGYFIG